MTNHSKNFFRQKSDSLKGTITLERRFSIKIWYKVFKSGLSKGCLPQNLLSPLLNTFVSFVEYLLEKATPLN